MQTKIDEAVTPKDIHHVLMSEDFDTWFKGAFEDYVCGEEGAPSEDEIMKDIAQFFGVPLDAQAPANKDER